MKNPNRIIAILAVTCAAVSVCPKVAKAEYVEEKEAEQQICWIQLSDDTWIQLHSGSGPNGFRYQLNGEETKAADVWINYLDDTARPMKWKKVGSWDLKQTPDSTRLVISGIVALTGPVALKTVAMPFTRDLEHAARLTLYTENVRDDAKDNSFIQIERARLKNGFSLEDLDWGVVVHATFRNKGHGVYVTRYTDMVSFRKTEGLGFFDTAGKYPLGLGFELDNGLEVVYSPERQAMAQGEFGLYRLKGSDGKREVLFEAVPLIALRDLWNLGPLWEFDTLRREVRDGREVKTFLGMIEGPHGRFDRLARMTIVKTTRGDPNVRIFSVRIEFADNTIDPYKRNPFTDQPLTWKPHLLCFGEKDEANKASGEKPVMIILYNTYWSYDQLNYSTVDDEHGQ
jgi:hypothetical protein